MADPNYMVMGNPAPEANNDEYIATLTAPDVGTYDYAVRFSADAGQTFLYCDTGDGVTADGSQPYAADDAGNLVVETAMAAMSRLLITDYIEGGSGLGDNKAIEIYNFGPDPADLGAMNCELRRYANAGTTPGTITLSAVMPPRTAWVVCDNGGNIAAGLDASCDQDSGTISHNGNDHYDLVCDGVLIDSVGDVGNSADYAKDTGMRRSCSVGDGDSASGVAPGSAR